MNAKYLAQDLLSDVQFVLVLHSLSRAPQSHCHWTSTDTVALLEYVHGRVDLSTIFKLYVAKWLLSTNKCEQKRHVLGRSL